jgi:hypothetical protein
MFRVAVLVLLGGCNLVFGAGGATEQPDALDAPDARGEPGCWDPELLGDDDMDTLQDGCDPCPADADVGSPDNDGDGVGDRCDISSSVSHRWTMFAGFHDPAHGWALEGGAWAVEADALVSSDPLSGAAAAEIPPTEFPVLQVAVSNTSGLNLGAYAGVQLSLGLASARCYYSHDSGDDHLVLEVTGEQPKQTPFNAPAGIRVRLFQDDKGRMACSAVSATATSDELRSDNELTSNVATRVTLFTKLTGAAFPWVSVYGRRAP